MAPSGFKRTLVDGVLHITNAVLKCVTFANQKCKNPLLKTSNSINVQKATCLHRNRKQRTSGHARLCVSLSLGSYADQRYAEKIPMQCISMSTAICITTLMNTMVNVYLIMVPALSMSTAKCIWLE